MAFVYWITDDLNQDIKSYGYVGITSKSVSIRLNSHRSFYKKFIEKGDGGCKKLYSFVKSFGGWEFVKVVTVCESTLEYCLFIENKLRNLPNIGWNTCVGGDVPQMQGRKLSQETKNKLKIIRASWVMSEQTRKRLSEERIGNNNPAYGTLPWEVGSNNEISKLTWLNADNIYCSWKITNYGTKKLTRLFLNFNYWTIDSMIRKFKSGWNPNEDLNWIKYKENNDN